MNSDSKTMAGLSHFLQLVAGFIPALIILLVKDNDEFVKQHSKEVLNFQITLFIGYIAAIILSFVLIGFILYFILPVLNIVFAIIGGMKAMEGKNYQYPMTIRFIK